MLSSKEKIFKRYWEQQRMGGQLKYILLYSFVWGFVIFLLPLAISVIIDFYSFFNMNKIPLWLAILLALFLGFAYSYYTWHKNEDKLRSLSGKEGKSGMPGY
jgi:amino acid transporter